MGSNDIEVIIPVYKPDKKFYVLLERLLKQKLKPESIKLVLTCTEEFSGVELIKELAKRNIKDSSISLDCIDSKSFDHGGTRRKAGLESECSYCLFMTQDAVPADRYLTLRLLEGFYEKDIAVCYARQLPYKNAKPVERFARTYNYPEVPETKDRKMLLEGNIKALFCSDVCAMYSMEIFKSLGGFVEKTGFNEDMMYAHKALTHDYRVRYVPSAMVYHSHNLSLKEQFKRNHDLAVSQKMHPEVFEGLSSEKEGIKYVRCGMKYMIKNGNVFDCISLIINSGVRFLGFKAGKLF